MEYEHHYFPWIACREASWGTPVSPSDGYAIIGLTRCLARVSMANTGSVTVMASRTLAMNGLLALPPHSTNQMPCEQSQ
jgi:hypothetical protein